MELIDYRFVLPNHIRIKVEFAKYNPVVKSIYDRLEKPKNCSATNTVRWIKFSDYKKLGSLVTGIGMFFAGQQIEDWRPVIHKIDKREI